VDALNDTDDATQRMYDAMLLARSPEERVRMASSMFDSARAIMRAGLEAEGYSGVELRVAEFLRLYGEELDPSFRDGAVAAIRNAAS
jgi:hypothetical protein